MTHFQELFTDAQVGHLTLNNRMVVAPMTRISATEDGRANEVMERYYANFANGGFGLIISEGTYLDESFSQSYFHQPSQIRNKSKLGRTLLKQSIDMEVRYSVS